MPLPNDIKSKMYTPEAKKALSSELSGRYQDKIFNNLFKKDNESELTIAINRLAQALETYNHNQVLKEYNLLTKKKNSVI